MSHAVRVPPPLTAAGLRGLFTTEHLPHDDVLSSIGGHFGGVVQGADPLDEAARGLFDLTGAAERDPGGAAGGAALPPLRPLAG